MADTLISETLAATLVITQGETIVTEQVPAPTIIISAEQGPAGVSATTTFQVQAGEALGGHRAVVIEAGKAMYASKDNPLHANRVVGITSGAAALNDLVTIYSYGELDGFAGLTPDDKLYVQDTGIISNLLPTTGFIQQIGISFSATKALILFQPSLTLA